MFYDQSHFYEMSPAFRSNKAQAAYDEEIPTDTYYYAHQVHNAPAVVAAMHVDSAAPAPSYGQPHDSVCARNSAAEQYNISCRSAEHAAFLDVTMAASQPQQQAPTVRDPAAATDEAQALNGGGVIDLTALQNKTKEDGKAPPPPVDHESLTALVNARERDVKRLLATLATPLANWNAKFIWHCVMKMSGVCDATFAQKVKEVHKAFYVPPAISFYALWLHYRFWTNSPKLYFTIENRLPATFGAGLGKEARTSVFMYYLAVLFANKHLDDFSYRNSSWYEAAGVPAADFLQFELVALGELKWSLEITSDEWLNWIDYLQFSNTQLERTAPTHQTYHWAIGNALYEAVIAMRMLRSAGSAYSGSSAGSASHASSASASPHMTPHPSEMLGMYGHLQPTLQPAPVKYIPWDTSEDPVVEMRSHRRSSSLTVSPGATVGNLGGVVGGVWGVHSGGASDGRLTWTGERGFDPMAVRCRGPHAQGNFAAPVIEGFGVVGKGPVRMHERAMSTSAANPLKSCNEHTLANWAMTL